MPLGITSYRLSQAAGPVRVVEDFIVEDWEVEGQAKPNRVCWLHLPLANLKSLLVRLLGILHCIYGQKKKTLFKKKKKESERERIFVLIFLATWGQRTRYDIVL